MISNYFYAWDALHKILMHSHYLLSNATARGWELSYVNKIRDRLRNIVRDKTRYWPTWEVGGRFSPRRTVSLPFVFCHTSTSCVICSV